jgi:hypothetical protein
MDYLYPVPFVLAWLWCLVRFEETAKPSFIFLATFALGVGLYSYIGALVVMPLYAGMTLAFLLSKYRSLHSTMLLAVLGFCLPLIPAAVWIPLHPGVIADTVVRYETSSMGTLHLLRSLVSSAHLQQGLDSYWTLNSPGYLFFSGSSNWVDSTRHAGVFLVPLAILMLAGFVDFVIGPRSRLAWLILAGLLTAPLGAVFVGEAWAVQRELELIPFAVLLATFGVRRLRQSTDQRWRWVAVAALALMPLQFVGFYHDYFTDYRLNSLGWFGPPFSDAVSLVLQEERNHRTKPSIVISRAIPYGREHWQFQLAKAGREDLLIHTGYFDAQTEIATMPTGSIVVEALADGKPLDPRSNSPLLQKIGTVKKADGGPAIWLLRR